MVTTSLHESPGAPVTRPSAAHRVLVALHGHEPEGWLRELPAAVARAGLVRVLAVDGLAPPAFTSLLPAGRRRYGGALAAARGQAEARTRDLLEALGLDRPGSAEVVRLPGCPDPGRAIAACARTWPADVVVVGRDARGRLERAFLGSVHERVIEGAGCTVLVVQGPPPARVRRGVPDMALPPRAAASGGA